MDPISRDDLTSALTAALQPLLDVTKEMQQDIKRLELGSASRTDVYTKEVMDEKLNGLAEGITSIKTALKDNKEFTWKILGAGLSLATLLIYILPHIHWS